MFGSRKDAESREGKRRFWPFGRAARAEAQQAGGERSLADSDPQSSTAVRPAGDEAPGAASDSPQQSRTGKGFLARMRGGLRRTSASLAGGVAALLVGKKEIDDELLEDLESQLLQADLGVEVTTRVMKAVSQQLSYRELDDADALFRVLKKELKAILAPLDSPLVLNGGEGPCVILVVGVNGVGKTTTIAKMASRFQREGRRVMLAAGDTFRAAAVEQLCIWGERQGIPVVAQQTGADSASVVYDAFEAARARAMDVLIVDTAGRLHNKDHLMEELKKVRRVLGRQDAGAPHEVMLVVDAGTGQNALSQARLFHEAVGVTGLVLTKLDGTARGGMAFALAQQTQLPIRFIGVGEQEDDLRPFCAEDFVDTLLDYAALSDVAVDAAGEAV
ncbi:MAG: signal recognition particle-docking protein FtsY [Kistimonas sp.]|nr:signal recognition particle-docking protein FtsY [Kistimonas sp.]